MYRETVQPMCKWIMLLKRTCGAIGLIFWGVPILCFGQDDTPKIVNCIPVSAAEDNRRTIEHLIRSIVVNFEISGEFMNLHSPEVLFITDAGGKGHNNFDVAGTGYKLNVLRLGSDPVRITIASEELLAIEGFEAITVDTRRGTISLPLTLSDPVPIGIKFEDLGHILKFKKIIDSFCERNQDDPWCMDKM